MQELLENMPELAEDERTIVATRLFAAPRELVYAAFANPKHVIHWWGPSGFSTTILEMDLRPGGKWRLIMHGPDGTNYPNDMIFTSVIPGERVEMESIKLHRTITWADEAGGTRLTLRNEFGSRELRDENVRTYKSVEGVRQLFVRLEEFLTKKETTA